MWGAPVGGSAYLAAFGAAGTACSLAAWRARGIDDPAVSRGLVGLLAIAAVWALTQAGRIAAPTPRLAAATHVVGLIIGFTSVGAWLYFCSAYVGANYHRSRRARAAVVGLIAVVSAAKLTNPIHGLYFETLLTPGAFLSVTIVHLPLHWLIAGVAYALSGWGLYLLYRFYRDAAGSTTRPLALAGLTALPVGVDIVGYTTPLLAPLYYEPIGVAAFAIGVFVVADRDFFAVSRFGWTQVVDDLDAPIVMVDRNGIVRDFNDPAAERFPSLSVDRRVELPTILAADARADSRASTDVVTVGTDGNERHYARSDQPITLGTARIGTAVVFENVTDIERSRRELAGQNERLESFAAAVDHELRNDLNVTGGYLTLADEALGAGDADRAAEAIAAARKRTSQMDRAVGLLSSLAHYGSSVDRLAACDVEAVTAAAAASTDLTVTVDGRGTIEADGPRLHELFDTVFRFLEAHDATTVDVVVAADGFDLRHDASLPDRADPEAMLTCGEAAPDAETGLFLPTARALAEAHGWSFDAVDDDPGPAFRVSDASVEAGRQTGDA